MGIATQVEHQTAANPAGTTRPAGRTVAPLVDVYETEKAFVILADMPGVKADGLDVLADRDVLVITGRVSASVHKPTHQEFELAGYRRTFVMTEDLDTAGIAAALRDGVLRVDIPKSSRLQPKKIPVRTS